MKSLKSNLSFTTLFLFCLTFKSSYHEPSDDDLKFDECYKHLVDYLVSLKNTQQIDSEKTLMDSCHREIYYVYDKFIFTKLGTDILEHFEEIQSRIEKRNEDFKNKIDQIALNMSEDTKKYERMYRVHFDASPNSVATFMNKTIFSSKKRLNQEFFMKAMKIMLNKRVNFQKSPINISELNSNLSESSSLFNEKSFESYDLVNFTESHPINSQILTHQQYYDLINLCEFDFYDKWSLLYRGSRDGFGANDFHSKCDGHSQTLTILKAKKTLNIFGAFTTVEWESCTWPGKYKSDANAFIFSLTNQENKPLKMRPIKYENAVFAYSQYGPAFGKGFEILIANNSNKRMDSYSDFGHSYKHPQYAFGTKEAQTFLTGSYYFQLDEIEVYQKE
jgi:hypothetical protein